MKLDIEKAVKQSAEDLIDLEIVEDCDEELLQKAIEKWLENFIDELPDNIEWFYQNNSSLKKLIFNAQLQSETEDLKMAS